MEAIFKRRNIEPLAGHGFRLATVPVFTAKTGQSAFGPGAAVREEPNQPQVSGGDGNFPSGDNCVVS